MIKRRLENQKFPKRVAELKWAVGGTRKVNISRMSERLTLVNIHKPEKTTFKIYSRAQFIEYSLEEVTKSRNFSCHVRLRRARM
jgi:hypothetical protein